MPTTPIHILHAIRQTTFGGGEMYVANLVRALRQMGVLNTILTFQDGAIGRQLRDEGFEVIHYPTTSPFDVKTIRLVAKLLADRKTISLVHAHGTRAASNVLLPAKWAHLPSIYTVHGWSMHPGLGGAQRFVRRQIESWICKLATKVVCVGQQDALFGAQTLNIPKPDVIVNGIPVAEFAAIPPLQVQRHKVTFGFVGRMTYQKYPELLALAFSQLSAVYPEARLVFVGGGELEPAVKELLKTEIANGQAELRAFSQDVPSQLASIDCLVLPSRWEGLSLSLIEGMVAGRYCIASDILNNAEVITDGITGTLVSINEVHPLTEAMRMVLLDPERTNQIAGAARVYGLQHHDFASVAQQNKELYDRMLGH